MSRHIIIAGGSGFIGRRLAALLSSAGHRVTILTRRSGSTVGSVEFATWSETDAGSCVSRLDGADAVINLCGESIAGPRWTDQRKAQLIESRVQPTRTLLEACAECARPPGRFLQASGVGFYGTGNRDCVETTGQGQDFLAHLAAEWEAPVRALADQGPVDHAIMRLGVVLGKRGGALPQMLLPFKTLVGGPIGDGMQWLSWIHIADAVAAIAHLLELESLAGVYNLSAPAPVRNHEFAEAAARALHRPNWVPMPKAAMKLLLGEQATLVCDGQRALPHQLAASGFQFQYPDIASALADLTD